MSKSPLQKISAKQASLERRWGYFKSDQKKTNQALASRVAELESLLTPSSAEHDSVPAASGAAVGLMIHQGDGTECHACWNLAVQTDLDTAAVQQIHDLHQ